VHQHSSGDYENVKEISKIMVGYGAKIYLVVDFHGNLITFFYQMVIYLIDKMDSSDTDILCTDQDYNSNALQAHIK